METIESLFLGSKGRKYFCNPICGVNGT